MKFLLKFVVCAVLSFAVVNTAEAGKVKLYSSADFSVEYVKRTLRGLAHDGFTEVSRSMQFINYFAPCTDNCKYVTYTIVMNSPTTGDYSLTQTYAYVNVVVYMDVATGGYYVQNVWVEETIAY